MEYDYIVCGGGVSGCTLAARLAEDASTSVLLIEAGHHSDEVPSSKPAGGALRMMHNPEYDWTLLNEPTFGLNGRQTPLNCGKILGGSSVLNGTLSVRGLKRDFDAWNLKGWSGDEVFDNMQKAESFTSKEWFHPDERSHGHKGPLGISPHDLAPISKLVLESLQSKGIPLKEDMFSSGYETHGCGHVLRTISHGFRMTSAVYVAKLKDNLTIMADTMVDKVSFEGNKAVGVNVIGKEGSKSFVRAKREIIISAGTYSTPTILFRSGIGRKPQLEKHGIQPLVELPGVGQNLQDHLITYTLYQVKDPKLTTDHQIWHGDAAKDAMALYMKDRTGFLSTYPWGVFAYADITSRITDPEDPLQKLKDIRAPHIEFFNSECYIEPPHIGRTPPTSGDSAFAMVTQLFQPRSRGTVELGSANPGDKPVIQHNYLDDPLDAEVLAEGCRFSNEIILEGAGTKDVIAGAWPATLKHHKQTTREQWVEYVRNHSASCYHPVGTCKMGQEDDDTAVLDAELHVRGVQNLRVADASIIPTIPNGHTQMIAYAIGEKAATLIKGH